MNIQYIKNNTEPTDFIYQVNIENRIYFVSAPESHLIRAVILIMPELINSFVSKLSRRLSHSRKYSKMRVVAVFKIKKHK